MPPPKDDSAHSQREVSLAVRNGFKLIASLGVTLFVAFAVRFWMPRFLGPEAFGALHFAEEFAATCFVLLSLGVDVYIRKEIAVRQERASEIFWGLMLIRGGAWFAVLATAMGVLYAMDKSRETMTLVAVFGVGQFLLITNHSLGALLQANGTVTEEAVVKAVMKPLWGAGIVGGLLLGFGPIVVAISFTVTEALKTAPLLWATRKHLGLRFQMPRGMLGILGVCAPYFINDVSVSVYAKIDVSMLSGLSNDKEVGWYGGAANVTLLIFLLMPIINQVVIPMGARLAAQSHDALNATMRSTIGLALILTTPIACIMAVNSETIVTLLFRQEYAPATDSLSVLALRVPLAYLGTLLAVQLIQVDRIWELVKISLIGLAFNPILNILLIERGAELLGTGGAATTASFTTVVTDVVIAGLYLRALGREIIDAKLWTLMLRLTLVFSIVAAFHVTVSTQWGMLGLIADAAAYVLVAVPLGALPIVQMLKQIRSLVPSGKMPQEPDENDGD